MKSKYGQRPDPLAPMVKSALAWIDTSLAYHIPVMTEYSAFSRALLSAAVRDEDGRPSIEVTQAMVARSMEFLHHSDIMNVSALITYPEFMSDLLTAAFGDAVLDKPVVTLVPSTDALVPS
jgi:hypothetical protein